jgi:hypothetical protein
MASIYINGKCYHVVHNRLEKNHNFNNKYDYAENDAHTVYTIEFTRNKAVFDKIGDANFDFDWYDIMQYDNINDAIKTFTSLYYDDSVLFVHMFMDVYCNGKIILSECKDNVMYSILDKPSLKRLENAEKSAKIYQEKYERLQKFVDMYNIDDSEIDRRLRENQK